MAFVFATGERFNNLSRSLSISLPGLSSADPLFPITNLYDGRPSLPFRFSSLLDEESIIVDMQILGNAGLENWSDDVPEGWTKDVFGGSGTVVETTDVLGGEVTEGNSAAEFSAGSAGASLYRDVTVRPGERMNISSNLRGDGTNPISLRVQCLETGRFLTSASEWSPTAQDRASQTANSYTPDDFINSFQVESLERCGYRDEVTLRITLRMMAGGPGFADNLMLWPHSDLLSMHGLSVDDRCVIRWDATNDFIGFVDALTVGSADDGFGPDQIPNVYIKRPVANSKRFQRITFDNGGVAPARPREVGELILCQSETLQRNANYGVDVRVLRDDDVVHQAANADRQVYGRARWPRRALAMRWLFTAEDQVRQHRDELWGRAGGGRHPLLLIPNEQRAAAYLVRLDDTWSVRREFNTWQDNALTFSELPFVSAAL